MTMKALEAIQEATAYLEQVWSAVPDRQTADDTSHDIQQRRIQAKSLTWDDVMPLTDGEARRAGCNPLSLVTDMWNTLAPMYAAYSLGDYKRGDLDLSELLNTVRSLTIYCHPEVRVALMGWVSYYALRVKPKHRNARRPAYPRSLRLAAVGFVQLGKQYLPKGTLMKTRSHHASESVLAFAIRCCEALNISHAHYPIKENVLYDWYLELGKPLGIVSARGFPRRHTK